MIGWFMIGGIIYGIWHWPKQHGKKAMSDWVLNQELHMGQHVHRASSGKLYCEGGDSECPLFEAQLTALMQGSEEEE